MPDLRLTVPDTPVGPLTLYESDGAISALTWEGSGAASDDDASPLLQEAARQLREYFAGTRQDFDLPLAPRGTTFQKQVYRAMQAIPYGATKSYGEIAEALEGCARAVGSACGSNPIPVIIPCHRVLAAGGKPGGFSGLGGLDTKKKLLDLEGSPSWLL